MSTDDTRFSVPAVWSALYFQLSGSPWEDEDLDNAVGGKNPDAIAAAHALRHVYQMRWKGVEAEDGVLATLKAAARYYGGSFLTPGQIKDMGGRFLVCYDDRLEPMDDYLEKNCGEVRWHWLNEHGKQEIEKAVVKDTEIWVEDVNGGDDVWVFSKPGQG